jgi:general L-amino acid transport system permease protein
VISLGGEVSQAQLDPQVEPDVPERAVWYRSARFLRLAGQVVAVVVVVALIFWLWSNLVNNLHKQNIGTGFGFVNRPTQFQIPFDEGFDSRSPVWQMVLVGVKNTFLAGAVGIVIASIVGLIVGVSRLSSNYLVRKMATVYVEVFRNIPPLVIIIFFAFAIFTFGPFPVLAEADRYKVPGTDRDFLILSNSRWGVPGIAAEQGTPVFVTGLVLAVVAFVVVAWWRTRRAEQTGGHHHRVRWGLLVFAVVLGVAIVAARHPFTISWPELSDNGRRIDNGFELNFGFISVAVALGLYTASHIAEIIRGSILAVPKGQTEAANAIALSALQRYRHVILPQATKIAVPPTINQYLNLVKNTSLGIAVAFAEITALTTTSIGNGRPAPQSIVILMAVYLVFSLTISLVLNVYNRKVQLVER